MDPFRWQIDPFEPIYPIEFKVNLIRPQILVIWAKAYVIKLQVGSFWPQLDPFEPPIDKFEPVYPIEHQVHEIKPKFDLSWAKA